MSCPNDDTLAAFAAGRLDALERFDVVDHAGTCEHCHAAIDALEPATIDPSAADVEMIGRYELRDPLGSGGMGVVYAARDPELGRDIAIKLLRAHTDDSRLRREAQALARLAHPNVIAVHDVGVHHGQTFVAMARIDGEDLRAWLKTPRSTGATLRVLIDAGRGLAAAHAVGLIHRDLKPENILVTRAGHGLVGDFGLARDVDAPEEPNSVTHAREDARTVTGTVLGTPAYMAPEQAKGAATAASDQFSFCVTAWEALYGARPSSTRSRKRRIPAHVHRALVRGLAEAPAARHASIDALLRALAPRRRWAWTWPVIAVAGIAAAAIAVARPAEHARCRSAPQRLVGIWDPPQRVISQLALGRLLDVESSRRAIAALDHVADHWSAAWTTTCRATERSPSEFDRKVACLDRQLAGLAAATRTVATADATVARHVFDLTARLNTTECDDTAPIAAPPPAQRAEVARIDDALEHARVANFAGKPSDATALATVALADARRTGYSPLVVRALLVAGYGGDQKVAIGQLREAVNLALAAGDDYTVARALIALAGDLAYTGQLDETERELALAVAALTRIDKLTAFAPDIEEIRANVAAARGQYPVALDHLDAALTAFHARGIADPLAESTLVDQHGGVLVYLDRAPEAIADYKRALALTIEAVGPANPLTALAELELASATIDANGLTRAGLDAVTHAHATLVAALGPDNYDTAFVGLKLAKLELELDDLAAARPLCEQLIAAFTTTVGRDAGKTFDATLQLAKVDLRQGHLAEAATAIADVEARMITKRGKDYVGLADALRIEGELRLAQGQPDAAFAAYDRAAVLITAALGDQNSELLLLSLGKGLVELARSRPDRALVVLRPLEKSELSSRDAAIVRLALADALWQTGDHSGARTVALTATAGLDAIGPTANPAMRAQIAAWIAKH